MATQLKEIEGGVTDELTPHTAAAMEFLRGWLTGDGFLSVTAIIPDGTTATLAFNPDDAISLEKFIDSKQGKESLYFSVNPLRKPLKTKATKEDVAALEWLHVDVDPEDGKDLAEERARIKKLLETFELKPNVIIDSGGGYQAFWRLREPIPANESIPELERHNKRLEQYLGGDHCHNIDRIMRLPGTINVPNKTKLAKGRKPALAKLIYQDEGAYNLTDFDILGELPSKKQTKQKKAASITEVAVPDRFKKLLETDTKLRDRWDGDTDGLNDTSRSGMDMSLASLLKRRSFSNDEIAAILRTYPHGKAEEDGDRYITRILDKLSHDDNPIEERGGRLCKWVPRGKSGHWKPISTFTITPIEAIDLPEAGEHLRVKLIAGHKVAEVDLPPDAFHSSQKFISNLPSKEFAWLGATTGDVQWLRQFLSKFDMPSRKGVGVAGFHKDVFVTEDGALSRDGQNEDFVFLNKNPSRCKLVTETEASADDLAAIKEQIDKFNVMEVVAPVLGWTAACFFKERLHNILGHFPLLLLEGEAGAGKTSTVQAVTSEIWGLDAEPKAIAEQTKFTFMQQTSGSNAIPLIYEENKQSRMNQWQANLISSLIRATYNGLEGQRGRANQTVTNYRYSAPICIVGESGFSESALLDRVIGVQFSKKSSAPHQACFDELKILPLRRLGRTLVQYAFTISDKDLGAMLEDELSAVDESLKDRPRDNAAVARFGLRVLERILGMEFDRAAIDRAVIHGSLGEAGKERKSAVDGIIEVMSLMSEFEVKPGKNETTYDRYKFLDHLEEDVDYTCEDGKLWLYVQGAYPIFQKWARIHEFSSDVLPLDSFRKQLKNAPYFLEKKLKRIGGSNRNSFALDINVMREMGLELSDEWASF